MVSPLIFSSTARSQPRASKLLPASYLCSWTISWKSDSQLIYSNITRPYAHLHLSAHAQFFPDSERNSWDQQAGKLGLSIMTFCPVLPCTRCTQVQTVAFRRSWTNRLQSCEISETDFERFSFAAFSLFVAWADSSVQIRFCKFWWKSAILGK